MQADESVPLAASECGSISGPARESDGLVWCRIVCGIESRFIKAPMALKEKPYNGKRVAVRRGAAGELVELVEAGVGTSQ